MDDTKKVFIMGIDGMDPKITQQYLKEGIMPNLEKFLKRGAARENLAMIGGQPTVTPPMWTTLATGASPFVHSVHSFSRAGDYIGLPGYNFDSRNCLAEQMWNVTAENGIKTLVWHWAGSAWPPSSDSPNLYVIDGTQPEGVNCGNAVVEDEKILIADEKTPDVKYRAKAATDSKVPCFITGMEFDEEEKEDTLAVLCSGKERKAVPLLTAGDVECLSKLPMDLIYSPIRAAEGWANAPEDAKECTIIHSEGLIRRPCLILKNEKGIYDTMQIFTSKKSAEPIAVLKAGEYVKNVIDDAILEKNDEKIQVNRNMRILEMAEAGSHIKMWVSAAMDFHNDTLWYPKSLLPEIVENVGYPQPCSVGGGQDLQLVEDCMRATWEAAGEWTAEAIHYLIKEYGFKMVFSHFHNIDLQGHMIVQFLKRGNSSLSAEVIQNLFREVYKQTDRYIGKYLDMLDDGWTIMIVSDHGQTCPEYHLSQILTGDDNYNAKEMVEWGFTVLKKDENGNDLPEIDWSKTRAVMWRMGEVWINLKGREIHDGIEGIVEPGEEQWLLEEEIMTRILETKSPLTGMRVCTLALRNKDAVLLGMGGPKCGDIIYLAAEGYTMDHADSFSTVEGACGTSCMSIFAAAGPGIKENFKTKRVVHHVDVTPTIAALFGIRVPHECEGAPIYQILS